MRYRTYFAGSQVHISLGIWALKGGIFVGNKKLEEKGKVQKVLGEAQAKVGDVKKDVKDAKKGA